MFYAITVTEGDERPTAVVARATTWSEFASLWRPLLDEVYAVVGKGGGHNVMLYRDDAPNVEVGVEIAGPFTPAGNVIRSALPAGRVATATHRGPYAELEGAHRAIRDWCAARQHRLTGVRWEIYGDWAADPADLETEVFYLLAE